MRRELAAGIAALAVVGAPASAAAELPLGPRSLDERRAVSEVAPGVRWTQIVRSGGPWRVNVLEVEGRLLSLLSNERVRGLERVSAMARRARVPAAVNGGFFASDGNPVGALVDEGRVVSEPVRGRSVLLAPRSPGERARVAALSYGGSAMVGGRSRLLDGVDRPLGAVPACGGRGGDRPTERPDGARTCRDPSELIAFSPAYGGRTPATPGAVEVAVRDGVVRAVGAEGGRSSIPFGGLVLAGTGDAASFLRAAVAGEAARAELRLRAGRRAVDPAFYGAVVGGGPRLVARGRVRVDARAEGFHTVRGFVEGRHPRTLAGVARDGRVLLVTVDGRAPGWSAGVTLREAALVMRSLGARDALALDGGGSTAMVVRGRVVNRPSDRTGERPVSDALAVLL